MRRNQLGHLKHGHLGLAAEDSLQCSIGVDVTLVFLVLEFVLLNVVPEPFGDLATGCRSGSHNSCEDCVGLDRFKKGGIGFALRFDLCRHWFLDWFVDGLMQPPLSLLNLAVRFSGTEAGN